MPWDPFKSLSAARWWLWLAVAVVACAVEGPGFVRSLRPAPTEGVDFFQEWASAKNYFHGLPVYASHRVTVPKYLGYRVAGDAAEVRGGGDRAVRLGLEVNAHPPTSVLLALPFAGLDYRHATLAWNLVSLAALGASLWLLGRGLGVGWSPWALCPLIGLLLLCSPFRQQMNQGQLNLVLLLLLTLVWVTARSGRPVWCGVFLGLATAVKLFPGFLLLHFAIHRRWKIVASGLIALVAITLLTAVVLQPVTYTTYVAEVLPRVSGFRADWLNSSVVGLSTKLFHSLAQQRSLVPLWASDQLADLAGLLGCLAVMALWWYAQRRARGEGANDVTFGLSITTMLLLSPVTWDHYFLLLIIPLAILWVSLPATTLARVSFLGVILWLCLPPLPLWERFIPGGRSGLAYPVHTVTVLSYGLYGLLALFMLCYVKLQGAAANAQRCE
ncbi:MAG: DUF2029 domain-containing protein [Planctomycetales bacterium]|nr:DUF2029 domain-containing protein [Planctomycetales bacterium]NIM07783.1 DUF2029 domain-containing protein [Planctomycetales bacterium]NIN07277.1 DUF2029 domain-containing protein [Planctomycetales bacterium]NIN76369.1 DUF2029 domain-containing protein [Planctomycetales bacterium]NIO33578.1 DUF2029 domain-containing protein [Planctomycetales bacterium]